MIKHLGEKILHSEGHLERFTELDGEEKRKEGDRGDQEEKGGSQKGRDHSSQESVPYMLSQSGTPREMHRFK